MILPAKSQPGEIAQTAATLLHQLNLQDLTDNPKFRAEAAHREAGQPNLVISRNKAYLQFQLSLPRYSSQNPTLLLGHEVPTLKFHRQQGLLSLCSARYTSLVTRGRLTARNATVLLGIWQKSYTRLAEPAVPSSR